jgi:dUTP pyrophosphatase
MRIKPLVKDFIKPEYKREYSGGLDIYLQQDITLNVGSDNVINLGFAAEVPEGHVALLLPRSSAGMKGIALRNTVGVIDADYRGEWIAHLVVDVHDKNFFGDVISYKRGERLLQAIIVPFNKVEIELSDELTQTGRGDTGFGGTGR